MTGPIDPTPSSAAPATPAAADIYRLASSLTAAIQPADTTYSYPAPSVTSPLVATTQAQLAGLGCAELTAAPAARTDCSGWVSWLMSTAAPAHYAGALAFRDLHFAEDPCRWPRANVWYRYFLDPSSAQHFQVIEPFTSLLPGDLVVWSFHPFAESASYVQATGDTGHIVVVLASGVEIDQVVPQPAGTSPAYVAVSDASCLAHASGGGYVDRRDYGSGPTCGGRDKPGGVGGGVLTFGVDAAGRAVQFCFNASDPGFSFHAPGTNGGQPALLAVRPL